MRAHTLAITLILGALGALLWLTSSVTVSLLIEPFQEAALMSAFEEITANGVLVVEVDTDRVLYEKNADEVYEIASVTKLFTALVALRSDARDTEDMIVWGDYATEGTSGGLFLAEMYSPRELLFPLLLVSSNDAGTAIRRMVGREAYVGIENAVFLDAGLTKTKLIDGSGLSPENVSTARELATFLKYLREREPHILDITRLSSYTGDYIGWVNNNPAVSYDSWRGGKQGSTPSAGRTFAGLFEKDGRTYAVVLLGSTDLAGDIKKAESSLR